MSQKPRVGNILMSGLQESRGYDDHRRGSGLRLLLGMLLLLGIGAGGWYVMKHGAGLNAERDDAPAGPAPSQETLTALAATAPAPQPPARSSTQTPAADIPPLPSSTPRPIAAAAAEPPKPAVTSGSAETSNVTPTTPAAAAAGNAGRAPAEESATSVTPEVAATRLLKKSDALVGKGDLAAARQELENFLRQNHPGEFMALAYYRLGSLSRLQKREDEALQHWRAANEKHPGSVGARISAVALADTYFARTGSQRPDVKAYADARSLYTIALGNDNASFLPESARAEMVKKVHAINDALVFSPTPVEGSLLYRVQPGDMLIRIAREHGVSHESLMAINRIDDPRRIRSGQTLKILKHECRIIVDRGDLTLTWYLDGQWIRQYRCCIGPENKTPVGTYTIIEREHKPVWHDPKNGRRVLFGDPEYPLGTRWLGLNEDIVNGLGIHGTNEPDTIPGRVSNGCVRLHDRDVEELFGFAGIGTVVVIQD